ncbi:unnamed protein product [Darwinula stevensoni]|uniref:Peptidase S1 domain-containing protein n=1 Tax=Darwinula stevensoni TaxID=69355 RepID=A0A7R9AC48_9CRUS|nr:unnamed protein product [Darwinula stevensoni]CAG0899494.1 unnamed protein product [Darwinula stevensoni]
MTITEFVEETPGKMVSTSPFQILFFILSTLSFVNPLNLAVLKECGKLKRTGKIVGGTEASRDEAPWIVSLKLKTKGKHICGGTLISERFVLTAAHCVQGELARQIQVTIRDHRIKEQQEKLPSYVMKHDKVIRHAGYSSVTHHHDIALIRLKEPVVWDDLTEPACLPDSEDTDFHGLSGIVAGWGRLSEGGLSPVTLMKVTVPILENNKCKTLMAQHFNIIERQICAGFDFGLYDACQGDSGGPMVVRKNGRYIVAGIVSVGVGCARPKLPGVYTNVAQYLDWIVENAKV